MKIKMHWLYLPHAVSGIAGFWILYNLGGWQLALAIFLVQFAQAAPRFQKRTP